MKKPTTYAGLLAVVLAIGLSAAYAGSGTKDKAKNNAVNLTVTGENYCVACTLKKEGAEGACSSKGCQHALRVKEAKDAEGNHIDGMKGWTLHYLNNDAAADFLTGHHYEEVTVTGTVFKQERVIDLS